MKIVDSVVLIDKGRFRDKAEWKHRYEQIRAGIAAVDWPPGSGKFSIFPESGKKSGEGNGVKPIKSRLIEYMERHGWKSEATAVHHQGARLGSFDIAVQQESGCIAVEWETGNISSSHRSLNKMALLLSKGLLSAGVLIVPSRSLYRYLTDRIGNAEELRPYHDLWSQIECDTGTLEILVIEHDEESDKVPRIPKGTDGRARR